MTTKTQQAPQVVALDALIEHVGETLNEALSKIEAPQEIKDLADNLYMLSVVAVQIAYGKKADDEIMQKAMANALPTVAKAGGQLFTPSGETQRIKGAILSE